MLGDSLPPVLWWIHEGSCALDAVRNILPKTLAPNIHAYAVSDYPIRILKNAGFNYPLGVLPWGVPEIPSAKSSDGTNNLLFLFPGSVEERKGQDIAIQAIRLLDKEETKNARFVFVGKALEEKMEEALIHASEKDDRIEYMGLIDRETLFKLYQEAYCVVIPSRDDPLPVVAIESLMFSKPLIFSDHTGLTQYLEDGKSGLIFKSEDAKDLAKKMYDAILNYDKVRAIGLEGRRIYEENFRMEQYKEKVLETFDQILSEHNGLRLP